MVPSVTGRLSLVQASKLPEFEWRNMSFLCASPQLTPGPPRARGGVLHRVSLLDSLTELRGPPRKLGLRFGLVSAV